MVRPMLASSRWATCSLVLICAGALACNRGDVREWTAADHDHADNTPTRPERLSAADAQAQLAEVTWSRQCASCHGAEGRGDGPNSPMVNAPDLTRPDWQSRVSDEQIARAIVEGKGRMPKFEMPQAAVVGLIRHIRRWRGP